MRKLIVSLIVILLCNLSGTAQASGQDMQNMNVSNPDEQSQTQSAHSPHERSMSGAMAGMNEKSHSLVDLVQEHTPSGTDAEPVSSPSEMLMTTNIQIKRLMKCCAEQIN